MARHALKTDNKIFQQSWDEKQYFQIRFDDRNYHVGDDLLLLETLYSAEKMKSGKPLEYTGRIVEARISCKIKGEYGLKEGWCILGTWFGSFEYNRPEDIEFKKIKELYSLP